MQKPPSAACMRRAGLFLGAAIAALAAPGAASRAVAASCPASIVYLANYSGTGEFSIDSFVYDTTVVPVPEYPDVWREHVAFDRTQGWLSIDANSSGRMNASVRVVERFDITGVPAGTPVDATLEWRLDGWSTQSCGGAGCGLRFEGTLSTGGNSTTADANHQGPGYGRTLPLATTLSLPVHFVAGTPIEAQFFLDFGCGPGAGGVHVEGRGTYAVSGLPPEVHAVTCPGTDVTPARRPTWGSLKVRYR